MSRHIRSQWVNSHHLCIINASYKVHPMCMLLFINRQWCTCIYSIVPFQPQLTRQWQDRSPAHQVPCNTIGFLIIHSVEGRLIPCLRFKRSITAPVLCQITSNPQEVKTDSGTPARHIIYCKRYTPTPSPQLSAESNLSQKCDHFQLAF